MIQRSTAFPLTLSESAMVLHTALTGSTQDDLASLWRDNAVPEYTILIADTQSAGRGRVGRSWFSLPEKSLLASVVVEVPAAVGPNLGWVTLIGAIAAHAAIIQATGARNISLSWPNDVVVDLGADEHSYRKLAGILGEYCGRRGDLVGIILGFGLNISLEATELPTPQAASLVSAGLTTPSRDQIASLWLRELKARLEAFERSGGEPTEALAEINTLCSTLRPGITVGRPRDTPVFGRGVAILPDGSLKVETESGPVVVSSGEVALMGMQPPITPSNSPATNPMENA